MYNQKMNWKNLLSTDFLIYIVRHNKKSYLFILKSSGISPSSFNAAPDSNIYHDNNNNTVKTKNISNFINS